MRIISNFYDYYDSFSDKESYMIYNRQEQEFPRKEDIKKLPEIIIPQSKYFQKKSFRKENETPSMLRPFYLLKGSADLPFTDIHPLRILIGKKAYTGIMAYLVGAGYQYYYTKEEVLSLLDKYPVLLRSFSFKKIDRKHIEKEVEAYFQPEIKEESAIEICRYYNSPVILYYTARMSNLHVLRVNPCLKDINFQRVVDPFTLFQDISQFYGTYLVTEKEVPVVVSDKDKIKQHGFDLKTSFRNM